MHAAQHVMAAVMCCVQVSFMTHVRAAVAVREGGGRVCGGGGVSCRGAVEARRVGGSVWHGGHK